ncbi:MAG: 5-formyltetrahydrofolate cyclo-ligase [Isosphaeraceae bacterium]|nr:5-formyltetrahydrofolate cyclo-ligase [Isosphaeraceae bacterium]
MTTPEKSLLRKEIRRAILALDPAVRSTEEAALNRRFAELFDRDAPTSALLYAKAFPEEFDLGAMQAHVLDRGARLILPRVDRRARRLRLFEVADPGRDLVPGALGIPEPADSCRVVDPGEVAWVLVPGLAFDRWGTRLGRGAGYYDRLLPELPVETRRVSLCFRVQWVDRLPKEPHDAPVDEVADSDQVIVTHARD